MDYDKLQSLIKNTLWLIPIALTVMALRRVFYLLYVSIDPAHLAMSIIMERVLTALLWLLIIALYGQVYIFFERFKRDFGWVNPLAVINNIIFMALLVVVHFFMKAMGAGGGTKSAKDKRGKRRRRDGLEDGTVLLSEYTDDTKSISGGRRGQGGLRKLRWRGLGTNAERIRFIYIAFLRRQIRTHGMVIVAPHDTPEELFEKLHERDRELDDKLFELYNKARYSPEPELSDEDVDTAVPYAGISTPKWMW